MHSLIIHDISRDILTSKVYEGDPQTEVNRIKSIENGDDYNLSAISMSTHTGTHIDAPLHFSSDGSSISKMRLNTFTGKCTVVTVNGILTGEDMDKILAHSRKKLLLHGNCKAFVSAFAARVLADSDVAMIGTDAQSIAPEYDENETHKILAEAGIAILENPYILVTDKKISSINDLLPLLEAIMKQSRPLLLIAEEVDGEALSTLTLNTLRGSFNSVAVKAPSFGEKQREYLQDIALLTGATFVDKDLVSDLKQISLDVLGEAKIVKVFKDKTIIIGGNANKTEIEELKEKLKAELSAQTENYEIVKLEDRIARLSDGVAVIEVGAPSEIEMHEKKLRIEDALSATDI